MADTAISDTWFGTGTKDVFTDRNSTLVVVRTASNAICTNMTGEFTTPLGHHFVDLANKVFGGGRPGCIFHNWWDVTGYDAEVRSMLTDFAKVHMAQIKGVHILLRSPLVVVGVRAANLILGGVISAHARPAPFLDAYQSWQRSSAA